MEDIVLETKNLTKSFNGKIVVNKVNMQVRRGDIYGFIGKNGAGKTTLMRLALDLISPTAGSVTLFGGKTLKECGIKIGSLLEAPALYKNCTAEENIKRFAILYGMENCNTHELLTLVGLDKVYGKTVGKFSLGMKQRLGIAIALLGEPELIILDEPVNGLDPEGIKLVRELILKLNREKGVTFLISSHLLDELAKVATKFGIINNGILVEEITAEDIVKECVHFTSLKVSDVNKALSLINEKFPTAEAKSENDRIFIKKGDVNIGEINKLLANNDVLVLEIVDEHADMESYFIEKMDA